jgi:radical SAM superfamily enzyme YgiQ (UPF0313 family)
LKKIFNRKEEVLSQVRKRRPDFVMFSVYTSTYAWNCEIARIIKQEMDVKIVFGGMHATLVPEKVIKNDFVDFVIVGEGDHAIIELVDVVARDGDLMGVPNLWYKNDGDIMKNPLSDPIPDINSLPLPDKDLFKDYVYHKSDYVILTCRGCVFNCSYCCESYLNEIYKNRYYRRRSVDSVMEELLVMKGKYDFKRVMFFDSVFFSDRDWLKDFLPRYREEISVPFRCAGHVSFVDKDIINEMKISGCYCIDFGVQTFNEKLRKELLNRPESNQIIERAFSICDQAMLRYDVDLIMGIPSMSEKDYILALLFMQNHRYLNRLKCYNLSYYPRLEMIKKARALGFLSDQDVKLFEEGDIGDWFHIDKIKEPSVRVMKNNFEKLYKIYPLIPRRLMDVIIKREWYRSFHFFPNFLVIIIQLVVGILKKDYRFYLYIKNYINHIKRYFRQRRDRETTVR